MATANRGGLPGDDWSCAGVRDAAADPVAGPAACAFCGTRLRWVHRLAHPAVPGETPAGRCCAARLCFGYDAAGAEKWCRGRAARLERFLDPAKWAASRANPANVCRAVTLADGTRVRVTVVRSRLGGYGAVLSARGEEPHRTPGWYKTAETAKRVAFAAIDAASAAR